MQNDYILTASISRDSRSLRLCCKTVGEVKDIDCNAGICKCKDVDDIIIIIWNDLTESWRVSDKPRQWWGAEATVEMLTYRIRCYK